LDFGPHLLHVSIEIDLRVGLEPHDEAAERGLAHQEEDDEPEGKPPLLPDGLEEPSRETQERHLSVSAQRIPPFQEDNFRRTGNSRCEIWEGFIFGRGFPFEEVRVVCL